MIKTYYVEDLTLEQVDALIEKGEVFNVQNKSAILPESRSHGGRDSFWGIGDNDTDNI